MSALHLPLKLHPDSRCDAVTKIEVIAGREGGSLVLRYVVSGDMTAVMIPDDAPQGRADGLWKHTCFEAFVRIPPSPAYFEFNFGVWERWSAYRFESYRKGMAEADIIPVVWGTQEDQRLELRSEINMKSVPRNAPWQVALSAVIEEKNGRLSYWALNHTPGKPDFHHEDCFVLDLPAASAS